MKELEKYPWPEVKDVDMAFPTYKTDFKLLTLSEKKPYEKGRKTFARIFFRGAKITFHHPFAEWEKKAFMWVRAFMKSYDPKQEHKESICAMIFEEIGVNAE